MWLGGQVNGKEGVLAGWQFLFMSSEEVGSNPRDPELAE